MVLSNFLELYGKLKNMYFFVQQNFIFNLPLWYYVSRLLTINSKSV